MLRTSSEMPPVTYILPFTVATLAPSLPWGTGLIVSHDPRDGGEYVSVVDGVNEIEGLVVDEGDVDGVKVFVVKVTTCESAAKVVNPLSAVAETWTSKVCEPASSQNNRHRHSRDCHSK